MTHPIQDLERDKHGVIRFKKNKIVEYLLDEGPFDLNGIAVLDFTDDDRAQFAQLIGYSKSGIGDLRYISDELWDKFDDTESMFLQKEK